MTKLLTFRQSYPISLCLALFAGSCLPLAFAPMHYTVFAILSPAFLLYLWLGKAPIHTFWLGLSYGLGMFGVGTSWIFISIHRFGHSSYELAILLTLFFVITLALFLALQGYFFSRISTNHPTTIKILVDFPLSWVTFEWIRSYLLTGFPWLYLGYSQSDTVLKYYATVGSIYLVSLIILLLSSCCILFFFSRNIKPRLYALGTACLLWGGGALLSLPQWTVPIHQPLSVALVQGNIAPNDKFLLQEPIDHTWAIYGKLTQPYWNTDLIIWPENALPIPLSHAKTFVQFLQQKALTHQATLLLGVPVAANLRETQYYNALLGIGLVPARYLYYKQHLVPFGEFVPLERWLRGLIGFFDLPMSSFINGKHHTAPLSFGKLKSSLMPCICYEIAFPELIRTILQHAEVLVTISEDGWFGDSLGPHQHLQIAQMRAIETGRYLLRSTTSGISAIIDTKGQIIKRSPQFQEHVLSGHFQPMQGSTPWLRWGMWPLFSLMSVWILCCLLYRRQ